MWDNVRPGQTFVRAGMMYLPKMCEQDNGRAGTSVHSVEASVSVCVSVRLMKRMGLNVPGSFTPVCFHDGHGA